MKPDSKATYYATITFDQAVSYYVSVRAANIGEAHDLLTYFNAGTRWSFVISAIASKPQRNSAYVDLLTFESPRS